MSAACAVVWNASLMELANSGRVGGYNFGLRTKNQERSFVVFVYIFDIPIFEKYSAKLRNL